jgi:hypothetical protein
MKRKKSARDVRLAYMAVQAASVAPTLTVGTIGCGTDISGKNARHTGLTSTDLSGRDN